MAAAFLLLGYGKALRAQIALEAAAAAESGLKRLVVLCYSLLVQRYSDVGLVLSSGGPCPHPAVLPSAKPTV